MHLRNLAHLLRNVIADVEARTQRCILRQVHENRGEHVILALQRHAADIYRCILALGELHGRFITRTFERERIHRSASCPRVIHSISMNRNKQIRLVAARNCRAFAMIHINITVANKHGLHSGFGIDTLRQLTADLQRDIFFASPPLPDSTRIMATVSCIDGDYYIAARPVFL